MKKALFFLILLILCLVSCKGQPSVNDGINPATPCTESNAQSNHEQTEENNASLLTVNDLKDIILSHAEGSGSIRTLTIHYMHNGKEKYDTINLVRRIDLEGYDDENGREQTFTVSDYDNNGIFDIIVYREFWFPDLIMVHPDVSEWPTVYEYDLENGFVVVSAKHKDYFETYAKTAKEQLAAGKKYMSDVAMLALSRLIYAAEQIADGSFVPESQYSNHYYADVYELTKDIDELTGFFYISKSGLR